MKILKPLAIAAMSIAMLMPRLAQAAPPSCHDKEVRHTFWNLQWDGGYKSSEMKSPADLQSDDASKRWCVVAMTVPYQEWSRLARMWSPAYKWRTVIYTVEWINESQGRFWISIQSTFNDPSYTLYTKALLADRELDHYARKQP
jgi:hypothetical protein